MRFAAKVHVLDQHVGGEEQVFGSTALAEDGAIVPNAQNRSRTSRQGHALPNSLDEIELPSADSIRFVHLIGSIMVPKMPNKATAAGRVPLVLLLLCAVVCAQAASLASEHFHQHASQHCCGLCHAGPLPLIQPSVTTALAPTLSVAWIEWSGSLDAPHQVLFAAGYSRAPPA
jgi:hypothetical protein